MPVFLGFLGVLAFSFTLPATRVAVEQLDPTFVGIGREAIAALLAGLILLFSQAPLPSRAQLLRIGVVASGVVFGWPLFTAIALQDVTSAHSAVIVGLLPAATAVAAVLRAGEHPSRGFWLASLAGLVAVRSRRHRAQGCSAQRISSSWWRSRSGRSATPKGARWPASSAAGG